MSIQGFFSIHAPTGHTQLSDLLCQIGAHPELDQVIAEGEVWRCCSHRPGLDMQRGPLHPHIQPQSAGAPQEKKNRLASNSTRFLNL